MKHLFKLAKMSKNNFTETRHMQIWPIPLGIEELASWQLCEPRPNGFWVQIFATTQKLIESSRTVKHAAPWSQSQETSVSEGERNNCASYDLLRKMEGMLGKKKKTGRQ